MKTLHKTSFSRQLFASTRLRHVLLLTIFARLIILRLFRRHKRTFLTNLCIDTFLTRPLVDGFCTTTRHFTSYSTSQVVFFKSHSSMNETWRVHPGGPFRVPHAFQNGSGMNRTFAYFSALQIPHWVELNVKWRVVAEKSSTRARIVDVSLLKVALKKTSCDVELDVKRRVVLQKSSTRGCVEDVSICKVVLTKTSCDVKLYVKWRVVVQKSSTRKRVVVQKQSTRGRVENVSMRKFVKKVVL